MARQNIFNIKFAKVYPLYVQKAERKNRTKEEVDEIICWLTGYDRAGLKRQIEQEHDLETFFEQAPAFHPNSALIASASDISPPAPMPCTARVPTKPACDVTSPQPVHRD